MSSSGRSRKMLARLPAFMRAEERGKVLGHVCQTLGYDLDQAEQALNRIKSSHRLQSADEAGDILKLAALLGLEDADFAIHRRFYENGYFSAGLEVFDDPASEGYARYLDALRDTILRMVRLLMDGCGSIYALLEGSSILLHARTLEENGRPKLQHLDPYGSFGGFVHRLAVEYSLYIDEAWEKRNGTIYLLENPIVEKEFDAGELHQRETFRVERKGFFHGRCTITIQGLSDRTVKPLVINLNTGEGAGYRGNLAEGQELIFSLDGKAYLDGMDVTDKCYTFKGGLWDYADIFESGEDKSPEGKHVLVTPPGSMDRNFPRPVITPAEELPVCRLKMGETDWRFSVEEGAFDASAFDQAVFAFPETQSQIALLPASGKVDIKWREHTPFKAVVLIPSDLQAMEAWLQGGNGLLEMLRQGLERFRAAGIELEVQYYDKEWVLGHSMLEDAGEDAGEGIDFNVAVI